METRAATRVRFGAFEADLRNGELLSSGRRVPIQRQPFEVLTLLVERAGQVVTRDELRARVWSDQTFVDFEHGLNTAIRKLRHALGDSPARPRYLETIARRGYRLRVPVECGNGSLLRRGATLSVSPELGGPADDDPLAAPRRHLETLGGEPIADADSVLVVSPTAEAALRWAQCLRRRARARVGVAAGSDAEAEALARRLCDGAGPGEIVVSASFAQAPGVCDGFVFHERDPIPDGGDGLLVAFALEGGVGSRDRLLAHPPFVGRAGELQRLAARLAALAGGRGGVVLVSGEPGIGKTRLVEEFGLRASAVATVLSGRCIPGAAAAPYGALAQAVTDVVSRADLGLLRTLLDPASTAVVAKLAPVLRARLPDLPEPPPLRPDEERQRLRDAVEQLVGALAKREPLVLVLDDLHWADEGTLALLVQLAQGRTPVLLIGTYRAIEVDREHPFARVREALARGLGFEELALTGVDADSVRTILEAVVSGELKPHCVAALRRATDGNPFFLREVLLAWAKTLPPQEAAPVSLEPEDLAVPESVQAMVASRLARLSAPTRRFLATASVRGDVFPFAAVARAAAVSEGAGLDALDEALDAQLIRPAYGPEEYAFAHALVRQALYEALVPRRRNRCHRRMAEALQRDGDRYTRERAAEIAEQYHASRTLPGAEAGMAHALLAADRAEDAADFAGAARLLGIALDLAHEGSRARPRLLGRLALACAWAGATAEALQHAVDAGQALAASEGASAAADYLADAASVLWAERHTAGAWQLAEAGLLHIGARRDATWAILVSHDLDRRAAQDPSNPGVCLDAPERHAVWPHLQRILEERQVALARDAPRLWFVPLPWMVFESRSEVLERWPDATNVVPMYAGDYRRALGLGERLASELLQAGRLVSAAWERVMNVRLLTALGELARAQDELSQASAFVERLGQPPDPAFLLRVASFELLLTRGEGDGVIGPALDAILAQDAPDDRLVRAPLFACAALGHARAGNVDAALAALARALPAVVRAPAWASYYPVMLCRGAEALWVSGRCDHAAVLARNLREKTLAADFRYMGVDARLSLAWMSTLQSRYDEAAQAFADARRVLDEDGARPLRAIADLDEASMVLRRGASGDPARFEALLDGALARFEAIGMPGWVRRAEALRARLG